MSKILSTAPAEAVYAAMCELNNVDGLINVTFSYKDYLVTVEEDAKTSEVTLKREPREGSYVLPLLEVYGDQEDFAVAYDLEEEEVLFVSPLTLAQGA